MAVGTWYAIAFVDVTDSDSISTFSPARQRPLAKGQITGTFSSILDSYFSACTNMLIYSIHDSFFYSSKKIRLIFQLLVSTANKFISVRQLFAFINSNFPSLYSCLSLPKYLRITEPTLKSILFKNIYY